MPSRTVVKPWMDRSELTRVLIADPDKCLLAAYRECFWEDFELVTATCGVECISRLRERTADVLVLEPQLPWGGGDGVLAIMREDPGLAVIPVMIVTSCRDVRVLKRIAPYRISDYSVKSLAPAQLATRIRNVLEYECMRELVVESRLAPA